MKGEGRRGWAGASEEVAENYITLYAGPSLPPPPPPPPRPPPPQIFFNFLKLFSNDDFPVLKKTTLCASDLGLQMFLNSAVI